MTRSERLWKDGRKFYTHLNEVGEIKTYAQMNSTPCTYFESVRCFVNGVEVTVDIYYKDNEQGYIGVIGDKYEFNRVLFHRIQE